MALHTYVRSKLNQKYGDAVQPATGPIRADLLGNMWAQEWGNIYPLVAPPGSGDIGMVGVGGRVPRHQGLTSRSDEPSIDVVAERLHRP